MSMIKNPDNKVILNGKWTLIKITGRNKTNVRVKDLHYDLNKNYNNNSTIIYYKSLVDDGNDKTVSLIKAILATKNVTGIYIDNKKEIIRFEKEPQFLNKYPVLKISFTTDELKENQGEISKLSLNNLKASREQFLDKTMRDKDVLYNFDFSGLSSSYWVDTDKKEIFFALQKNRFDENFMIDSLTNFINKFNDRVLMLKTDENVFGYDDDYVSFSLILNETEIKVKYANLYLYNLIAKLVIDHNKKIEFRDFNYDYSMYKKKKK